MSAINLLLANTPFAKPKNLKPQQFLRAIVIIVFIFMQIVCSCVKLNRYYILINNCIQIFQIKYLLELDGFRKKSKYTLLHYQNFNCYVTKRIVSRKTSMFSLKLYKGSQVLTLHKLFSSQPIGHLEVSNDQMSQTVLKPLIQGTELFGDLLAWHLEELVCNIRSDLKYLCIQIFSDKFECT